MPLTQVEALPPPADLSRRPRRTRLLLAGALFAVSGLLISEGYRVVFGKNLHTVVAGKVYRCAQPDSEQLRYTIEHLGIRTVINLRGPCPTKSWYAPQCLLLDELGVARHDIPLSSEDLPPVPQFRRLIQVLESCEYPVLVHCRRGADRTGLVAAVARLLLTGDDVTRSRRQLSMRYGHLPITETRILHQVLDMYEHWLAERGQLHRPDLLREWVMEHYKPGHRWAEVVPLEMPERVPMGYPAAARFRVHNRSDFPWQLTPNPNRGVHLLCLVKNQDCTWGWLEGAGYFDEVVPPDGSIELTLALPAIRVPGRYSVIVDMSDPNGGWFFLWGSPKFEAEIEVVPAVGDTETR